MDTNFFDVIQILNKKNINYWICHGTLLGIVRDNRLIEWDHDIDIAVWDYEVSKSEIISMMEQMDFKLSEGFGIKNDLVSFKREGGRIVDFTFLKKRIKDEIEVAYVSYYFPKNFFMKCVDALSNANKYSGKFKSIIRTLAIFTPFFRNLKEILIKKNFFYKEYNLYAPTYLFKKIDFFQFKEIKIRVPSDYKKYLNFIYGSDWKKPKRNYTFPRNYKTF